MNSPHAGSSSQTHPHRHWTVSTLLGLAMSFATLNHALASPAHLTSEAQLLRKRAKIKSEMFQLASELRCRADDDCSFIEAGSKSCGGPELYVIYSQRSSMISGLKHKAQIYNAVSKELAQKRKVSRCVSLLPPEAKCIKHFCRDSSQHR